MNYTFDNLSTLSDDDLYDHYQALIQGLSKNIILFKENPNMTKDFLLELTGALDSVQEDSSVFSGTDWRTLFGVDIAEDLDSDDIEELSLKKSYSLVKTLIDSMANEVDLFEDESDFCKTILESIIDILSEYNITDFEEIIE